MSKTGVASTTCRPRNFPAFSDVNFGENFGRTEKLGSPITLASSVRWVFNFSHGIGIARLALKPLELRAQSALMKETDTDTQKRSKLIHVVYTSSKKTHPIVGVFFQIMTLLNTTFLHT